VWIVSLSIRLYFSKPPHDDRHRAYIYFQERKGWNCQFMEEDLKTSLPLKLHFTSADKVTKLIKRGGGITDRENRLVLDQAIATGRCGV
jgi:hypothetical protein